METNFLITGGNGFIGQNLVEYLRAKNQGYEILDLNNLINPSRTTCIDVCHRIPKISGNILVHLAAQTNVRSSLEFPRDTILRNVKGLLNCIDMLGYNLFKQLIFTSSASSSLATNPYLASKLSCEAVCKSYSESFNHKIKVLKLSSVYGPHSINKSSVIATFIKDAINKCPLTIFGDGSQRRDFIYISDVIDAIYNGKDGLITTGILTSIKSIALIIQEISRKLTGFEPRIHFEQPIQGEVHSPVPRTDIFTKVKIDEGLTKTFEWFLENYNGVK